MGHHVSLFSRNPFPSSQLLISPIPFPFSKTRPLFFPPRPKTQPPTAFFWLTFLPLPSRVLQSSTAMAALARGRGATLLHRQHEPLRRHLHRGRRPTGPTGRRQHHRRARGRPVPPNPRLDRGRDGEREVMSMDVRDTGYTCRP